jgi:KaiC/GvpD/RAD55 family RecA-like ATPase
VAIKRVDVGVSGMEKLLSGGLPEGSPTLVSGSPGTGKTIFCLQFLQSGLLKGESGIYITFEETKESILTAAENFGWDFEGAIKNKKLEIIECFDDAADAYFGDIERLKKSLQDVEEKKTHERVRDPANDAALPPADYQSAISQIQEYIVKRRGHASQDEREKEFMEKLRYLVLSMDAKRLVFDSLSAYAIYDDSRESMHHLIRKIRELKTTTLLISELPKGSGSLSRDGISEFICDGVLLFSIDHTKSSSYRKIRVEKMRHTKIDGGEKFLWFTEKGLEVRDRPQES